MEITNQHTIKNPIIIIQLSLKHVIVLLGDTITDQNRKYGVGGVVFDLEIRSFLELTVN